MINYFSLVPFLILTSAICFIHITAGKDNELVLVDSGDNDDDSQFNKVDTIFGNREIFCIMHTTRLFFMHFVEHTPGGVG